MKYLYKQHTKEIEINKSRFIAVIIPIEHSEQINTLLKQLKIDYPKANHYCYGYVLNETAGSSDDGEPAGTAGIPILEILKVNHLQNVLGVVIRYFGGIMLGAGGLIRAYSSSMADCISEIDTFYTKILSQVFAVTLSYSIINTIEKNLENLGVILYKEYGVNVELKIAVNNENIILLNEYQHLFLDIVDLGPTLIDQPLPSKKA